MKNHCRPVKLLVEQLESRLVPSAPTPSPLLYDSNWSGYAVTETPASGAAVSQVSGAWNVASVSGRNAAFSSSWVGIDGFSSSTVEQIGTESDTLRAAQQYGTPQYYAWFEMYPAYSIVIPDTIKPGDNITANVSYLGSSNTMYTAQYNPKTYLYTGNQITTTTTLNDNFELTITDTTQGWTFSLDQSLPGQSAARSSAEWIVEAPSSNSGVLPLASFSPVTFSQAEATISCVQGSIGSNGPAQFTTDSQGNLVTTHSGYAAMDMANFSYNHRTHQYSVSQILDSTSALSPLGDSFTVQFGATTPGTPSNGPLSNASMMDVVQPTTPPAVVVNFTLGRVSPAMPGNASILLITTDAVVTPNATTSQPPTIAVSFASNVSNVAVGSTNAPPGNNAGIALGAGASAADSDVQWFAPSSGSGALTPPAVVPPPSETAETAETAPGLSVTPAQTEPYLAGSMWNSDGGSTREQPPIYGTDVSAHSAAGLVLLGAVLNGRRRTSLDEEETEAHLRSI